MPDNVAVEESKTPPPAPSRRREPLPRWIGTAQHFEWLGWIVKSIFVMNVLDAFMTLIWVYSGRAVEANTFIADLVHNFPQTFVLVKLLVVAFGSFLLWRLRKRPSAVIAIFAAFLAYYFLVVYHLKALDLQLLRRFLA